MKEKEEIQIDKLNDAIDVLNNGKYRASDQEVDELIEIASKVKIAVLNFLMLFAEAFLLQLRFFP